MEYEIISHVGVGLIRFGMSRSELQAAVNAEAREFRRGRQEGPPSQFFPTLGLFAYYGDAGTCEAVEFSRLTTPVLDGHAFFTEPYSEVRRWLRTMDPELHETVDGLLSHHLGLALSAPGANELSDEELADDDDVILESVLVWYSYSEA